MDDDKEVKKARLLLLALIRSFFDSSPTKEKLNDWKDVFQHLNDGTGFSHLDDAIASINEALQNAKLIDIQNEYYELFENPFSSNKIQLCASFYIDGRLYGQSLVKLRKLLYNLKLGKSKNFKAPEDNFVFLLDTMMYLVEGESSMNTVPAQQELFKNFLSPCQKGIASSIQALPGFPFYKAVSKLLVGHMNLEECLFPE